MSALICDKITDALEDEWSIVDLLHLLKTRGEVLHDFVDYSYEALLVDCEIVCVFMAFFFLALQQVTL